MTLLRPHRLRKNGINATPEPGTQVLTKSQADAQVGLKDRLKTMLENEQLIPRVGRRSVALSSTR